MSYPFRLFCVIPSYHHKHQHLSSDYKESVLQLCSLAEKYNFTGGLIHYNHRVLNPWILTTMILEHTKNFIPLIALQPYSMPPLTAAKMVESLALIYGRKVCLNLITGAVKEELEEVGESINHEQRYERLEEYIQVVKSLLVSNGPVKFEGNYYTLHDAVLQPGLPSQDYAPNFFLAGSSPKGLETANRVADVAVMHPEPIIMFKDRIETLKLKLGLRIGIRLGIISRPSSKEALEVMANKFPETREGAIKSLMKKKVDSHWIKQLAELSDQNIVYDNVYSLSAYRNGSSYCPYLVGSYEEVAQYLNKYLALGVQDLLLDGPYEEEEFIHINEVLMNTMLHKVHYI